MPLEKSNRIGNNPSPGEKFSPLTDVFHENFFCSVHATIILPEPPRAPPCISRSESRHITAEASAAFGVPADATTVSELAIFPFKGGMLKTLVFPPSIPFHRPISVPSGIVQVKAPTHG